MKEWAWVLRACGKSKIKFVLYFVFLFFGNSHGNHTNRHCKSQTDCLLTEYCDLQYSGTCQCRDGYVSGKEGSPCVKGRHAGETCLLDAQCALLNPSLVCFEGRCKCQVRPEDRDTGENCKPESLWNSSTVDTNFTTLNVHGKRSIETVSLDILFLICLFQVILLSCCCYNICFVRCYRRILSQEHTWGLERMRRLLNPCPTSGNNGFHSHPEPNRETSVNTFPDIHLRDIYESSPVDRRREYTEDSITSISATAPPESPLVNRSRNFPLSDTENIPPFIISSAFGNIPNHHPNDLPPSYNSLSLTEFPPSYEEATRPAVSMPSLFQEHHRQHSVARSNVSIATTEYNLSLPSESRGTIWEFT